MTSAAKVEEIAAAWLAREDRGLSAVEAEALAAWLEQAIAHRIGYLRLRAAWRRADRLAALKAPRAAKVAPYLQPRIAIAAGLLTAVLCGGSYFAWLHLQNRNVYTTGIGRMQTVRLADGSRMELNTDTHLHAAVTDTERTVTLDAGEAYFDVVHDAKRPFVVYAGNRRITDLGTKFSVFRKGDDVQVVVTEGRVRVDVLNTPATAAPVVATGGNMVIARAEETLVVAKPAAEIADDLSWRRGMLIFNQQTLAEAAEQFNRYNRRHIIVEGKARDIRIGGSFKADNIAIFTQLIHEGFGLNVSDRGDDIIVSDKKN